MALKQAHCGLQSQVNAFSFSISQTKEYIQSMDSIPENLEGEKGLTEELPNKVSATQTSTWANLQSIVSKFLNMQDELEKHYDEKTTLVQSNFDLQDHINRLSSTVSQLKDYLHSVEIIISDMDADKEHSDDPCTRISKDGGSALAKVYSLALRLNIMKLQLEQSKEEKTSLAQSNNALQDQMDQLSSTVSQKKYDLQSIEDITADLEADNELAEELETKFPLLKTLHLLRLPVLD